MSGEVMEPTDVNRLVREYVQNFMALKADGERLLTFVRPESVVLIDGDGYRMSRNYGGDLPFSVSPAAVISDVPDENGNGPTND